MFSRKTLFRCAAIALSLIALEVVLSCAALISPEFRFQLTPPWQRKVLLPDPVLGYRMEPSYPGNDARGFRNPKAHTACDVLAVGDSMTYGFAAPANKCWPRVLGGILGVDVYNMSCGDYSPCEYYMLLEEGLKLSPRTVVVCLYLGNDMANAYRSVHMHGRAQDFNDCDDPTRLAFQQADAKNSFQDAFRLQSQRMQAQASKQSPTLWRSIASKSSLYATARFAKDTLSKQTYLSLGEAADTDSVERFRTVPNVFIFDADPNLATAFVDPSYYAMAVDLEDPRIEEGLRIALAALQKAKQKVEANGAELVVAVMPTKHSVYAPSVEAHASECQGDIEAYRSLVLKEKELWSRIKTQFEEDGFEFVHLGDSIRAALAKGIRPYPPSTNTHPNANGYEVVAKSVAAKLADQFGSATLLTGR